MIQTYRPEFEAALRLFAKVSASMEKAGFNPPILVGGAAVELYTYGAIATGDFDLVVTRQDALENAMIEHGFVKPSGAGQFTKGWVHPDLKIGFETVSSTLLDGHGSLDKVRLISAAEGENMRIICIEDLIADRMGQYASGTAPELLEQARALFTLYKDADMSYMEERI